MMLKDNIKVICPQITSKKEKEEIYMENYYNFIIERLLQERSISSGEKPLNFHIIVSEDYKRHLEDFKGLIGSFIKSKRLSNSVKYNMEHTIIDLKKRKEVLEGLSKIIYGSLYDKYTIILPLELGTTSYREAALFLAYIFRKNSVSLALPIKEDKFTGIELISLEQLPDVNLSIFLEGDEIKDEIIKDIANLYLYLRNFFPNKLRENLKEGGVPGILEHFLNLAFNAVSGENKNLKSIIPQFLSKEDMELLKPVSNGILNAIKEREGPIYLRLYTNLQKISNERSNLSPLLKYLEKCSIKTFPTLQGPGGEKISEARKSLKEIISSKTIKEIAPFYNKPLSDYLEKIKDSSSLPPDFPYEEINKLYGDLLLKDFISKMIE